MDFLIEGAILKQYTGDDEVIFIPEDVTEIMPYAFQNGRNIKKIVCPSTLTKLDDFAFYGCRELEEIHLPDQLKFIGESCFSYCVKLKSLILPQCVETIKDYAFAYCIALEKISIPESVFVLPDHVFTGCNALMKKNELLIFNHTCYGGSGKNGRVEIPSYITHIIPSAFHDSAITSVSIPGAVTSIPPRAFSNCKELSSVMLAEGIKEIEDCAFTGCVSLSNIELPNTLEKLGRECFSFCLTLNHVTIPPKITSLPYGLFSHCPCLSQILIPKTVVSFGDNCFNECNFTEWVLSDNILSIGSQCFGGTQLKRLHIGDSISKLPIYSFTYCTHLNELYISDKITSGEKLCLSSPVSNLHISAKFISQLTPENKCNAVLTFMRTHDTFSETGRKDWITYIRRKKLDIYEILLKNQDLALIQYFLEISLLSKKDMDAIIALTDVSEIKERVLPILASCVVRPDKPHKSIKSSNLSNMEKIIRSTSKSSSSLKKVVALEAAILFGSLEDVKTIWDKLAPFEFLNRAVCLCTQIGDLPKLNLILDPNGFFCSTDYGPMKAKYDIWNHTVILRNLIGPVFLRPKYVDWDEGWYDGEGLEDPHHPQTDLRPSVLSAVNMTYEKSAGVTFTEADLPDKNYKNHVESLKLIDQWSDAFCMSDFISYALLHGCVPLARKLLDSGYTLDPKTISYLFSVDDSESRRDVFYALSVSNNEDRNFIWKCIRESALRANEQIVLSGIILDYAENLFTGDFFQVLITECNTKKLKAKSLMETLIRKNQHHNLAIFLNSPLCRVKKETLKELIDLSKLLHCDDCTAELIKHI